MVLRTRLFSDMFASPHPPNTSPQAVVHQYYNRGWGNKVPQKVPIDAENSCVM